MAPSRAPSGLWRNRNWRLLWLGQAISLTGDFVFDTTAVLWVATVIAKGKPWAPAAVGGVLIAAAVPVLIVGPIAGVYVDRWDRRRTMMVADACRAVLIALLLLVPALHSSLSAGAQLAILYAVVAAASCFSQFFNPSRMGILGLTVEAEDRTRASGLLQATGSFAAIVGPPLAAPLLFAFGVQWALAIDAASFAASLLTLSAIRLSGTRPTPGSVAARNFGTEFREGVHFFAKNRTLMTLCLGAIIATLGTGALNALAVFFVTGNLHAAASRLGLLLAGEGAGAVAGALVAGRIADRVGPARMFWTGLIACGIVLFGFSRTTTLAVAIAVLAVVGITVGTVNTAISPLLLGATPQQLIGRVVAVITPVQQLAAILAMAGASFLASTVLRGLHAVVAGIHFGPIDTVFSIAAVLFVIGGLVSIMPLRGAASPSDESARMAQPTGATANPAAADQ